MPFLEPQSMYERVVKQVFSGIQNYHQLVAGVLPIRTQASDFDAKTNLTMPTARLMSC